MIDALREDSMMAHLLQSLENGDDIGHYGRLVFVMIARHFVSHDDLIEWLGKDRDFTKDQAVTLVTEVESQNYSPPKREKILDFQHHQKFAIIPDVNDPDCGNVYRTLKFPDAVYEHIAHYRDEKTHAHAS